MLVYLTAFALLISFLMLYKVTPLSEMYSHTLVKVSELKAITQNKEDTFNYNFLKENTLGVAKELKDLEYLYKTKCLSYEFNLRAKNSLITLTSAQNIMQNVRNDVISIFQTVHTYQVEPLNFEAYDEYGTLVCMQEDFIRR